MKSLASILIINISELRLKFWKFMCQYWKLRVDSQSKYFILDTKEQRSRSLVKSLDLDGVVHALDLKQNLFDA